MSYYALQYDYGVPSAGLALKLRSLAYLGFIAIEPGQAAKRYRLASGWKALSEGEATRLLALAREPRSQPAEGMPLPPEAA